MSLLRESDFKKEKAFSLGEILESDEKHTSSVIIDVLINAMQTVGTFSGLTGEQKKKLVLKTIEYELELPDELEKFIIYLIDILIQVENNELRINKKVKSVFSCCGRR